MKTAPFTPEQLSCGSNYYVDGGFHEEMLGSLNGLLGEDLVPALGSLAMLLLKPDAIRSGKADGILAAIFDKGYHAVAALPVLNPRERYFEDLYKFNLTLRNSQNQIASWWVNRQLYTMGPSLIMVVTRPGPLPASLHAELASLKGPSNPYQARPGDLRYDFAGCNRSVNLIHTSDDPVSMARELLIFTDPERLRALVRTGAEARRFGRTSGLHREALEQARLALASMEGTRIDTDLPRCIAHLATRALLTALPEFVDLAGKLGAIMTPSDAAWHDRSGLDAWTLLMAAGIRLQGQLRHQDRGHASTLLGSAIAGLLLFPELDDDAALAHLKTLEAEGIYVSAWERLVILSSAHYGADIRSMLSASGLRLPQRFDAVHRDERIAV
ncbi:nucleoside diphosphate kinase [Microvirga flocculans]|uniref:Nucleoside diphosphate kinase n=1 Tax=Microvirga flocculans TaxID=217168 RepID=A0A7W6N9M8_9HYPH|nr:nucleoside-diphosphate kinase [Microvirga flocculans]MBB4041643.1 nucleoside diphosphate kinase [Microvirga flocculans]